MFKLHVSGLSGKNELYEKHLLAKYHKFTQDKKPRVAELRFCQPTDNNFCIVLYCIATRKWKLKF